MFRFGSRATLVMSFAWPDLEGGWVLKNAPHHAQVPDRIHFDYLFILWVLPGGVNLPR